MLIKEVVACRRVGLARLVHAGTHVPLERLVRGHSRFLAGGRTRDSRSRDRLPGQRMTRTSRGVAPLPSRAGGVSAGMKVRRGNRRLDPMIASPPRQEPEVASFSHGTSRVPIHPERTGKCAAG